MALSLDDRLLGEKVDNYCSSSDDDDERASKAKKDQTEAAYQMPPVLAGQPQTGPKGVLSDYKRYKELKHLKELEDEKELICQAKKHALTCRTHNEDVIQDLKDKALEDIISTLDEDDEFLAHYRQSRMRELHRALELLPTYNKVYDLKAENFVSEIDSSDEGVTILVHVYEPDNRACKKVDEAFQVLFLEYPHVKFCRLRASDAHLSYQFSRSGVPAILIYKKGDLIGNLLGIDRDLSQEFYPVDLENYLIE
ncbi:Phosducin protein (Phlp) [Fasciola hepatica]|uniref:Phosducin protein (Phlp) n=1 Tax=Fasciola hepatica TaxID=6192 RepID=A0A4E0RGJ5_FASHE|nr:Phosducin protein (Phlp) [Fasciola hepatica]